MADNVRTLQLVVQAETEVARAQLKGLADVTGQTAREVDADLTRVEAKIDGLGSRLKAGGGLLGGIAAGFAGGALAVLTTQLPAALLSAAGDAIDFAGSIGDVAKQVGVTTGFLQEFRYAATQTGTKLGDSDTALKAFSITVGKAAEGNKTAAGAFKSLGVDIADANGNLKPTEQLYREVADAISKIPDPARQSAEAFKFFQEYGARILPLLTSGSQGFDALADAAHKLGIVLSDETIGQLNDLGAKAAQVKLVISAELAAAIGANASAIISLGQAAAGAIGDIGRLVEYGKGLSRIASFQGLGAAFLASGPVTASDTAERASNPKIYKGILEADVRGAQQEVRATEGSRFAAPYERARAKLDEARANLKRFLESPEYLAATLGAPLNDTDPRIGGKVTPVAVKTPKAKADKSDADAKAKAAAEQTALAKIQLAQLKEKDNGPDLSKELLFDGSIKDEKDLRKLYELATPAKDKFYEELDAQQQRAIDQGSRFVGDLTSGLADAAVNGDNLGDVLVSSFRRAAAEAVSNGLTKLLLGTSLERGALGDGLLGSIGKFLGFADGGDPPVGVPYLVGERGPELRIDRVPGTIIPNRMLRGGGGGGGTTIVQNITVSLAGNAATREDAAMFAGIAYQQSLAAIKALGNTGIAQL